MGHQCMVSTETPGPGAPGPILGHADLFSLTRSHGGWQSWCQAPCSMQGQHARRAHPQATLSGDGSLTRRQEPAAPTPSRAQPATQRLWTLSLCSEMSSLGKAPGGSGEVITQLQRKLQLQRTGLQPVRVGPLLSQPPSLAKGGGCV